MTEEEDIRLGMEQAAKVIGCRHRWEEFTDKRGFMEPGVYRYKCARCGAVNMIELGVDHE